MSGQMVNEYKLQEVKIDGSPVSAFVAFVRTCEGISVCINKSIFRIVERGPIGLSVYREDQE